MSDLPPASRALSIHDFIRSQLDEVGRLPDSGLPLPDEDEARTGGLVWAPGALDGTLGHHAGGGEQAGERAATVADAFVRAARRPTRRRLRRLHDAVGTDGVLDFLDPMIEELVTRQPDRDRLHDLGRWLATTSSDRNAVKVGLAVLGVTGLDRDVDVVRVLGVHEEFALFAAVALTNGLEEPESELWALAVALDGWGRIQCVERLQHTTDPAIRSWILREGYRNSVMYEYLAYIAATTGGLLGALRAPAPDRPLLTAAGEIIEALIAGGPAEDISDYEDGADAVEAFLDHLGSRAETLGDFHAVASIESFLADEGGWDDKTSLGWTASRREAFESRCSDILGREQWDDQITVGLLADDPQEFWRADQAARVRGLDTFDVHLQRTRLDPLGSSWYEAWRQADAPRAERLALLAREQLPLQQIASGPRDEIGLGPEWRAHQALDWSLQALRDHPGVGPDLVVIGLQSPVTRNRNMSLNVLKAWPKALWPAEAQRLAQGLATSDPNEQAREFAGEIVRHST